jgi:hypothetical protein
MSRPEYLIVDLSIENQINAQIKISRIKNLNSLKSYDSIFLWYTNNKDAKIDKVNEKTININNEDSDRSSPPVEVIFNFQAKSGKLEKREVK